MSDTDNMMSREYSISEAIPMVRFFMKLKMPVLILGGTGIGKSALPRIIARTMGSIPMIDFRAGLYDLTDLKGGPDLSGPLMRWKPSAILPNEERDGPEGILLLDEFTNVNLMMQGALFQLVLNRCIADYKLPDGWHIIACGNRTTDKSSAVRLGKAMANRFKHINLKPDVVDYLNMLAGSGYPPVMRAFHEHRGMEVLYNISDAPEDYAFPTPRSCEDAAKIVQALGEDADLEQVLRLVSCSCGVGYATELVTFMKTYKELPRLIDIINNPFRAEVPQETSSRTAIAQMLAAGMTKDNIAPILAYAARLPKEVEQMLVFEAVNLDKTITFTPEYKRWASLDANQAGAL